MRSNGSRCKGGSFRICATAPSFPLERIKQVIRQRSIEIVRHDEITCREADRSRTGRCVQRTDLGDGAIVSEEHDRLAFENTMKVFAGMFLDLVDSGFHRERSLTHRGAAAIRPMRDELLNAPLILLGQRVDELHSGVEAAVGHLGFVDHAAAGADDFVLDGDHQLDGGAVAEAFGADEAAASAADAFRFCELLDLRGRVDRLHQHGMLGVIDARKSALVLRHSGPPPASTRQSITKIACFSSDFAPGPSQSTAAARWMARNIDERLSGTLTKWRSRASRLPHFVNVPLSR